MPRTSHRRIGAVLAAAGLLWSGLTVIDVQAADLPYVGVVTEQDHRCGPGDLPETGIQGDVPKADQESGRAEQGYNCGLALVGHTALDAGGRTPTGNANMAWAGDCAYVAGPGVLFGNPPPAAEGDGRGVAVVDVADPTAPVHVRTLRTPGAIASMETLHAVETPERSILVVGQYGNVAGGNKPMDVYDVTDCANPELVATVLWPVNTHNLTISGNGRYVFATQPASAMDIGPLFDDDPATGAVFLGDLDAAIPSAPFSPSPLADLDDPVQDVLWAETNSFYLSHEAWPSHDGTTLHLGGQLPTWETYTIVDLTDWLTRDAGNQPAGPPQVISQRAGRGHSIRTARIDGRDYALHSEESPFGFAHGCFPDTLNPAFGPAQPWLTDVTDPADPVPVSQFGLDINELEHCVDALSSNVSAAVHYHDVDDPDDTTFVMASMWNAGIRVFDVRDPAAPVEVAYFNPGDVAPGPTVRLDHAWGHVRYVEETGHIWFATSSGGFWVVELEPQVRELLDLGPATTTSPAGRPGTLGVRLAPVPVVAAEPARYSCVLGVIR